MSCNLILEEEDRIFMCADSAVSTTLMGTLFRVDESGKKIYTYDNKMILFLCGKMRLIYNVAERFEKVEKTIENLQNILRDEYKQDILINDVIEDENFIISAVVGTMENGKAVMYDIASYNDFENRRIEGSPLGVGAYSAGIKVEECLETAIKYMNQKYSVQDIYRKTINEIAFEGIGGTLTVYYLDNNGVHLLINEKIKEKPNLKRITDVNSLAQVLNNKYHCIMADMLIGRAILGTKMTLADEDGQFNINGKNLTFKDDTKSLSNKIGKFNETILLNMEELINE